jgi:hypothetical protein
MNEISCTTPFKNFSPVGFYRDFVLGILKFFDVKKKMKTVFGFHLVEGVETRRKKSLWISVLVGFLNDS